jgi:hypothetical protein
MGDNPFRIIRILRTTFLAPLKGNVIKLRIKRLCRKALNVDNPGASEAQPGVERASHTPQARSGLNYYVVQIVGAPFLPRAALRLPGVINIQFLTA